MTSAPLKEPVERMPRDNPGSPRRWQVGTLSYTAGGLAVLFLWLIGGDLALNVRDRAIPPVMQVMFKMFNASDTVTGLVFASIPAALNLIVAPVVAFKSDRLRSRWGRRVPFMLIPVPFIVLATFGLGYAPQLGRWISDMLGTHSPGQNASSLVAMSICWTTFEVGSITTYAVFGAFMADVVPQAVMGLFFGLFRAVGLLAGITFYFDVLSEAQQHYTSIFLITGAIYAVAFTAMCLGVKEGRLPPDDPGQPKHPGWVASLKIYFREGYCNPYYLIFFAAMILCAQCGSAFNLYAIYYSENIGLGVSNGAYGRCVALSYAVSFFLSIPLGLAADRYHPLRLSMAILLLYAVVMAGAGFLVRNSASFALALVAHTIISGSLATSTASLTQRLLPRGNFAVLNSACGVLGSIVGIFFAPFVGRLLDSTHHDYRYTFFVNAGVTAATFIVFVLVHQRFMALGGPRHYVAPEPQTSLLN